jgi:MinD superfamily P-loop ATPase
MNDREMYCATCETETLFEAPPLVDDHDEECPELLCTGCGTAILIAPVVVWSFTRPPGSRVAPHQRRAA